MKVSDEEIEKILASDISMAGHAPAKSSIVGTHAKDFSLQDHTGSVCQLSGVYQVSPVLLVFYPQDFSLVCTKQLCNYRDSIESFRKFNIMILGVSKNSIEKHARFVQTYSFPFRLLSDDLGQTCRNYGCHSIWMLQKASRAVFIINKAGTILYRYVEPTVVTRRSAKELLTVIEELDRLRVL